MNITTPKHKLTILWVEDDVIFSDGFKPFLEATGKYEVILVTSGREAWEVFKENCIDICLLDVHIPGLNGLELGRKIRAKNPIIPIMYISADRNKDTELKGYEGGADDYCQKPIAMDVFLYRMEVLVRRAKSQIDLCKEIDLDGYKYTTKDASIKCNGKVFRMGANEITALTLFIKNLNETVSIEELKEVVFGFEKEGSLTATIKKLRDHFKGSETVKLHTIRGIGYLLEVPRKLVRYK
ncbi:DNA-binding response OmpR family regulator [Chitinophaga polysaccharea]|uniref:DNA-binding response OmpR family regulator n=1 Tax=Chitinophaga polysaccharea TaxID=1293035 RepID=A0A561Q3D6_9BACT|nr:response regulator transcription factor [Chitinophaga polysaccharea]TWF44882.1 DNA-binding response OmpR family regulator [Chitinophaga polysaccharea]